MKHRIRRVHSFFTLLLAAVAVAALSGCSTTKHVPEGKYLVNKVDIEMEPGSNVKSSDLTGYLRQTPNHKVLGFLKLQLATYNLSGHKDNGLNRWLRRIGQPPVVYDPELAEASARQLRLAMVNRGYMDAVVEIDSVPRPDKKKIDISYRIIPGPGRHISSVAYDIPDTAISEIVMADTAALSPRIGELLDRNLLDNVRTNIANRLHDRGYYGFNKEYVTFFADTVEGSANVALTMNVRPPFHKQSDSLATNTAEHPVYHIGKVYFITDYRPGETMEQARKEAVDSVMYHGCLILYGEDRYIKPSALDYKCFITPGALYNASEIDRTYEALSRLNIIKTININMVPAGDNVLDAYILLSRNKKQSITLELDGTHSEGDLGIGGSVTWQHRDIGHRSEVLTAKMRANYESISGNLDGFINDRYTEYAAEVGLSLPKFQFPFLSRSYKRRIKATSDLTTSFNYQERPEYTRIIAGAAWKYKWNNRQLTNRRTLDLIDINYVYLPKSTIDFINQIAPDNPLLRYSYEDHLIMRLGYTFIHTNKLAPSFSPGRYHLQPKVYNIRLSVETAGNVLYAISNIISQKRDDGVYKVLGVPYSQYIKGEMDYSLTRNFSPRHSVAFHLGAGIGYPYGNSEAIPFEKRFYAGGANGVRGWAVRTLGPGSYDARNSVTSFINQCGDISLLASAEYRAKLFWVLEAGFFVDAGNIWTIKDYPNQPGGMFRFNKFWKEIALAYGVGLRLDFNYFLFRIDLGLKAYNPAEGQEHWPIAHPSWKRDTNIHFSVGYPF